MGFFVWVAPGLLALLSQAVVHLRQGIDFIMGAEKNLNKGLTPLLMRREQHSRFHQELHWVSQGMNF